MFSCFDFQNSSEGDLVKVDNVKLELLDEESLRQFLILRRDALKGFRIEGMELNNLVSSMLQDYAYILKGIVYDDSKEDAVAEIIIKIPLEIQTEFENKYSINICLLDMSPLLEYIKGLLKKNLFLQIPLLISKKLACDKSRVKQVPQKL